MREIHVLYMKITIETFTVEVHGIIIITNMCILNKTGF